jgi:hypothetical protein
MFASETSVVIRNILFLQLLTLVMIPGYALQLRQKLLRIWKSLNTPVLPKKPTGKTKKERFWEIDMTKFEP